MSVTLSDLRNSVNRELENYSYRGSGEESGDGLTRYFELPDQFIVPGSVACMVTPSNSDVPAVKSENVDFTMDYDSSVCTFINSPGADPATNPAPAPDSTIDWSYLYRDWGDVHVNEAINSALQSCYPGFYVNQLDTSLTLSTDTYEYPLPDGIEQLVGVDVWRGAVPTWKMLRKKRWKVYQSGADKTLHFSSDLTRLIWNSTESLPIRLHYIARPAPLVSDGDTLDVTAGIPDRAQFPLVAYACYELILQQIAPRVRSASALTVQGSNLSPRQMVDAANSWLGKFAALLHANQMKPWSVP